MCVREDPAEDPAELEDAGARVAGLAAVERFQRAAQQEVSQGQPLPPKRPYRTPSVPPLCALATRATVHLMTGERLRKILSVPNTEKLLGTLHYTKLICLYVGIQEKV